MGELQLTLWFIRRPLTPSLTPSFPLFLSQGPPPHALTPTHQGGGGSSGTRGSSDDVVRLFAHHLTLLSDSLTHSSAPFAEHRRAAGCPGQ